MQMRLLEMMVRCPKIFSDHLGHTYGEMRDYVRDNKDWRQNLPGNYQWWKHAWCAPEWVDGVLKLRVWERPSEHCSGAADVIQFPVRYEDMIKYCNTFEELVLLVRNIGVFDDVPLPRWGAELKSRNGKKHVLSYDDRSCLIHGVFKMGGEAVDDFQVVPRWTIELPNLDDAARTWDLVLLDELRMKQRTQAAHVLDTVLSQWPGGIPKER